MTLAACDGGDGLCDRLPDTDFRSEENISAILGPEGVEPAPEFLEFSDTEAFWLYSDVGESGEFECSGNRVSFLDGRFEADVLDEEGRLVLDRGGTRYLQE
jgi:hypothetical protein